MLTIEEKKEKRRREWKPKPKGAPKQPNGDAVKPGHQPGSYKMSHQSESKPRYKRKTNDPNRGRPSHFKPEYCESLVKSMAKGKTINSWLVENKVHLQTYRRWLERFPEFREAKDLGIMASLAYWESVGEKGCEGKISNFNASTYKFLMKNRFPLVYKDVHHNETTTTVRFETFVNESGQIEQASKQQAIEGEIIAEIDYDVNQ